MPQNGVDPLSNGEACMRDAIMMQKLGVNLIRVYNVDPEISHDDCAAVFNAAGIYMIIDVNSPLPNGAIDAADPGSSYDSTYLTRIFQVVDAFKGYSNLLGFFAGNEIINDMPSAGMDPPYIRAVVRDLHNYIAKNANRYIPVGYSAADVRQVLFDTWAYLQCAIDGESDDPSRIDFFGLNSYSWCGSSATYETSGYNTMVAGFADTTVPVFFSEYGCNLVLPRTFTEVGTIYGDEMMAVMSGATVYEWTQETNNYGLVNINSNKTLSMLVDYSNFESQLGKIDFGKLSQSNSSATNAKPPTCSSSLISGSGFNSSFDVPSPPPGAAQLVDNGVTGAAGGKSVAVSSTAMPVDVYSSSGAPVEGLSLKIESTSNTPTNSSSGSGSSSSNNSAAGSLAERNAFGLGAAVVGVLGLLLW